jgi:excisionase family DNA binding protein
VTFDEAEIRAAADRVGQAVADLVVAVMRALPHASVDPGEWLTTAQVADLVGYHPATVSVALGQGRLHGHQPSKGGRWRVRSAAARAWLHDRDSYTACGCGAQPRPAPAPDSTEVSVFGATPRSAKYHRNKGMRTS